MIAAESADCRFVLFANKADLPEFADAAAASRAVRGAGLRDRRTRGQTRSGAGAAVARRSAHGARRPVRHGQVDADQCAAAGRRGPHDRNLQCAAGGTPYDDVHDAVSAARSRERHVDRRLARDEGVRPRPSRTCAHRRSVRGDAPLSRPLPLPRLPPRRGARLRDHRGGGGRADRAAPARVAACVACWRKRTDRARAGKGRCGRGITLSTLQTWCNDNGAPVLYSIRLILLIRTQ